MTDPIAARAFLHAEIGGLEPFESVLVGPAGKPLAVIEVTRREDHGLEVRVPGRPPAVPELAGAVRSALHEHGFVSEDAADRTKSWVRRVDDAEVAVGLVQTLFSEAFGEKPDVSLDVVHASHKAEHEARQKLDTIRPRIEKVLAGLLGRTPEQDEDGDYVIQVNDVHVIVAPRAPAGGPLLVRVFAITNVGVTIAPDLGLFLARMNFGLMFGRFALDAEHRSIWFDETLLGERFSDDELRFTIDVVGSTADEWDDRLKQMFGGATYQEMLVSRAGAAEPPAKPGQGGYV
jgi:T3SS (YopN, CesT) and YbjN peptide-binding chaperone 1